jgi:hypothetical protein
VSFVWRAIRGYHGNSVQRHRNAETVRRKSLSALSPNSNDGANDDAKSISVRERLSASAPMPCRGVLRSSIVHLFRLAVARESQHARSFPSSLLSWTPRKSLDVVRPVVGRLTRVELQADAVLVLTSTTPAAPVAVGGRTWDRTVPILRAFTVASRRGGKETLRSRNGAGRGRRGGEVVVVR